MRRFKNILYLCRGTESDSAVRDLVAQVANRNGAKVTVFSVVEELSDLKRAISDVNVINAMTERIFETQRKQMEFVADSLRASDVEVEFSVVSGTPFLEIIRRVIRAGHDLVAMSAEGKTEDKDRLFGTTSLHLMRKCPCPVWALNPTSGGQHRRILAAVNPFSMDDTETGLGQTIMELATSLARIERAELHIAHAWRLAGERLLREPGGMPSETIDELLDGTERCHRQRMHGLLSRFDLSGLNHQVHSVKGEPAEVILALSRSVSADLVIMGTVGRTGVPGLLIGNTAESVLARVECSMLTVKPEGFVSPVTL